MASKKKEERNEREDCRSALASLVEKIEGFKPARSVLTKVRSVPTIFPQLNIASRVGGWPIERFGLIHGPSNEGKTCIALGIGLSFLQRDHIFAIVDAEYTTTITWASELMGEYSDHPGFIALRPETYEETVEAVRSCVTKTAKARESGEISPDTSALVVVDSLAKLVPDRIVEKLRAESLKDGMDGMSGRGGMLQAALNSQWLKELSPLLYHTGTALIAIGRESEKPNATPWETKYKVQGGTAPGYESSFTCRVEREAFIKEGEKVVGEKHRCRVLKTKVGGKDGKYTDFHFNTMIEPAGFDLSRDILEMAIGCGVVMKRGGRHSFEVEIGTHGEGEVFASSEAEAVKFLRSDKSLFNELSTVVEKTWQPTEVDAA